MYKKWSVLGLASLTSLVVYAMPALSLPVLFTEISEDLNLSLVQIGVVWGMASFASFLTSIPYGIFGDRFGPKRTLVVACLLVGIFGALRGFSFNYASFIVTVLLHALVTPAIPPNLHKAAGIWFPERRGLAAGLVSAGFALGLALGSGLSASVLSPWLGNWNRVLMFYGVIAIVVALLWLVFYPNPAVSQGKKQNAGGDYMASLRLIVRKRELWLIGAGTLSFWACYKGFSGYLPLFLKSIGWDPVLADQTLTTFYGVSLLGVVPLSILSDRYGVKRELMFTAVAVIGAGVLTMSFTQGFIFWLILILGGFFFDGFMAIHQAATLEVDGIGGALAGTALGFIATLREFGGFVSPPIGNALAAISPSAPFIFWGIMGLIGAVLLWFLPVRRVKRVTAV